MSVHPKTYILSGYAKQIQMRGRLSADHSPWLEGKAKINGKTNASRRLIPLDTRWRKKLNKKQTEARLMVSLAIAVTDAG